MSYRRILTIANPKIFNVALIEKNDGRIENEMLHRKLNFISEKDLIICKSLCSKFHEKLKMKELLHNEINIYGCIPLLMNN